MTTDSSDIRLVQTCGACPEQYDAFIGDRQVGYLRLRHGSYTVWYPDYGGELLFEGSPEGDGVFMDNERDFYLTIARKLIARRIDSSGMDLTRSDEIDSWKEAVAADETTLGYGEWIAEKNNRYLRMKRDES